MGFHIVKRENCPFWQKCCLYLGAVVLAVLIGACILLAIGVSPISYYTRMFTMNMIGNRISHVILINYLKKLVPLALTSVALSLAFKMRFWNIGGEGQFIIGAIASAFVALKWGSAMPKAIALIVMCLAAMLAAGLYGLIAAWLKVKFNTNETLMTLMLNYIALYLLIFLSEQRKEWNFFLDPESLRPKFASFSNILKMPVFKIGPKFELNLCVILTAVIGILIFVYLKYTKHGYEISVIGDSAGTANYAGMNVKRIILRTVFLSAALIGLAASFRVGTAGILSTSITEDVGWTGIIVAWLAKLNTGMIFLVSALICVLQQGSVEAATSFSQVSSSFANILQGLILFLVLTADFFTRFSIVRAKKGENANG